MAKQKGIIKFSNASGYRFVDDSGLVTAVMEQTGRFSLKDGTSSLEVFENWSDFVVQMGDKPVAAETEADVFKQLGVTLGLGRCEAISIEPNITIPHKEEAEMATKTTDIEKKKKELAKVVADRKAKAAKPAAKAKAEKTPKALNECPCGCGEMCARNFKQGHDARVHGWEKKLKRGEMKLNELQPITQKWMRDNGVKVGSEKAS